MLRKVIYKYIKIFITIFSTLSFTGISSFWGLSYFSIIFFVWNFLNENKYFKVCFTFFSVAILTNILNFAVLRPLNQHHENILLEWNQTGYDEKFKNSSQESLNIISRNIEEYKMKEGYYPNYIEDINTSLINNHDYSFRIKEKDGQINGISFFYEKVDSNKYYLAGVGPDGKIKTQDDLIPQISLTQKKTSGLIKYTVKSFSPEELEREKNVLNMYKKGHELLK